MTATIGLLLLGGLLGTLAPQWLDRMTWPTRSPGLGVLAWLTLMSSVFLCLLLATVTLVMNKVPDGFSLAAVLHSCSALVIEHGKEHPNSPWTVVGLLGSLGLLSRLTYVVVTTHRQQRRDAAQHFDRIGFVCTTHEEPDVMVLRHDVPSAYCLAGKRKQVIVTDGALQTLTDIQWRQVLAHERAHLRRHHHAWMRLATSFHTVLRGRLGSTVARQRIAELAEMHADDAADYDKRWDLAVAVLVLGAASPPVGSLGAGDAGGAAAARISRLTSPLIPLAGTARAAVVAVSAVLLVSPILLAFAPGTMSLMLDYCPSLL